MPGVCVYSQVYYEPMLKLDIMTESELGQIFGTLDSLIPLHQGNFFFLQLLLLSRAPLMHQHTTSFPEYEFQAMRWSLDKA